MLKKILAFGLLSLVGILAVITVTLAADGANNTKVDNCVGLTNGIKITRSGKTSTLVDGCRNAGHGMRNYTMSCVSAKLYRTTWKENCLTTITPTTTPITPGVSTPAPVLSMVLLKNNGNGKVTANVSITNAAATGGVSRIEIYRDIGSLVKTCVNVNTCSYDYSGGVFGTSFGFSSGYLASAKAYNYNGQMGTIQPKTFYLFQPETNGPVQTFTGDVISDRTYTLRLYSEDRSPLYRVEIKDGANTLTEWYSSNAYDSVKTLNYSGTVASYGIKRFTARSTDWFGNVTETTLDLNFITSPTTSISITASQGSERDVERVYLTANGSAGIGIREIQIYAGTNSTTQFLVERVRYTGHYTAVATATFPKALMPNGYYYARIIANDGTTRDTAIQHYAF